MGEEGKVEDEVCVLPGSSISVLSDKMGETEENVADFRAVTDIYVHILSVTRSCLAPVSCSLLAVASLPRRNPGNLLTRWSCCVGLLSPGKGCAWSRVPEAGELMRWGPDTGDTSNAVDGFISMIKPGRRLFPAGSAAASMWARLFWKV